MAKVVVYIVKVEGRRAASRRGFLGQWKKTNLRNSAKIKITLTC